MQLFLSLTAMVIRGVQFEDRVQIDPLNADEFNKAVVYE